MSLGLTEKEQKVLEAFGITADKLSFKQLSKLSKIVPDIKDPTKMNANQAMKIVKELGLNIKKIQKEARKAMKGQLNQTKIGTRKHGRNDPCLCGSEKKYKKCCGQ